MNITLLELRKIFDWKRVAICSLFIAIFSFLFLEFHFNHFPNGSNVHNFNVMAEMVESFGLEMETTEFPILKRRYEEAVSSFEAYLLTRTDIQEAGITNIEEFFAHDELPQALYFGGEHVIMGEIWAMETLIQGFESSETAQPIFPFQVGDNFQAIISLTALFIMMASMLLISPIYLFERKNKMLPVQYATKYGRKLFLRKILATTLASLLTTTFLLGIVLALYFVLNQTAIFFPVTMNSIWGMSFRYDITFGQYIWLTVGLTYLLGLIGSWLALLFSRLSPNHLTVLAIQIPLVIGFQFFLSGFLIRNPLSFHIQSFLPISIYLVLLVLPALGLFLQWKRECRLDIS